jgi:hypothetical protein
MRIFFFFIFICPYLLLLSCRENNSKWAKYTSKDGAFSIYMPADIVRSEKTEVTAFGKQVTHFVTWKPSSFAIDKFKLFQVSYTDCPSRFIGDSNRLNTSLDSSINLRKNDFTELKDIDAQSISLNGYPGRAFIYDESKMSTFAIVKECISNNRKYDLTVVAKKDYPTNAEINNFFNSFLILR